MKKKIIGIFVCMLVISATVLPVTGTLNISNTKQQDIVIDSTPSLALDNSPTIEDNDKSRPSWSIIATYSIPEGASGLAYNGTYLYCGIYGANGDEVYQIDPDTGSYSFLFSGPQADAFGLTYDGSYLWTTDHPGSSSTPAIAMQLDMSGSLISQFDLPDHYMSGIAYDNGDFWVATYYPDPSTIYKVNATGSILKEFTAPDNQPWDLCLENGNLWMADYWGDTLYKIDPKTGSLLESHSSEGVDPAGIVWDGQYLWYCDNGEGGQDYLYKVDLQGGGTPEINVPITNHDYGPVSIGESATWNVTVESIGTADLIVDNVAFTGSSELSCPLTFPITIPQSSSQEIPIVYEPLGFGALDATATIESNDPVHPEVDITLTGNGVYPDPDIHLPENTHNYGSVRIHATTRWFMEIQNHGNETLTVDNIVSDDSHFYVDEGVSFPFNVGTLASVEVGIWYQPDSAGPDSATLTITSNDPDENPYYVTLQGTEIDTQYPIGDLLWQYLIDTDYDNSPKAIAPILDISGDGIDDVIICSEDDYVRCFNGNSNGIADVLWEHEIYAGSIYSQSGLAITQDVDDDGYNDVVVGAAWGARLIRTISGKTGEEIWTHDTHEYGSGGWVYQVDCRYDYNGDGVIDVLASTGDDSTDTGPKRVYCLNGLNGISIWEYYLGGPGFSVIGVEDFTGDARPDVVAGASNEAETIGKVYGINGLTGNLVWPFTTGGSSVWALEQIDDISSDGIKDVIIGDFGGNIYGLNATNGNQIFSNSNFNLILRYEKLDDVNSDGHPDILLGHSGTSARVIDGYTGSFIWSQPVADKSWCVDRIADISGDGINDVLVGTLFTNNYCYFLNGVNGSVLQSIPFGTPVDAIAAIPDIVGDGSWEMVAGGRNGYVACYSGGVSVVLNNPPDPPNITGPDIGFKGAEYTYSTNTTDPDGDQISYNFSWDDGSYSGWLGPFDSGETCNASHTWAETGTYNVAVRAKDEHDAVSEWSDPYSVYIGVSKADFDQDGDVDLDDFANFAQCYAGAGRPPAPACPPEMFDGGFSKADFDQDGDVDLDDFANFAQCYAGAGRPPAPACPPDMLE